MEPKDKWLRLGEAVSVVVTAVSRGSEPTETLPAVVYCRTLDRAGRIRRSLRILGICWGLALLLVP
ncbi:MAG TPA: hypothetical protein DIU15_05420, partial [Deltaproteobacteria bacterium]|nr:hypothetical protein [Deltaproteobacteria bacterium]